jgi:biopolymer transport protein ExbD
MVHRIAAPKWWHEPIRIGLTVAWVGALTLWTYMHVFFYFSGNPWWQTALEQASTTLRSAKPLWFAAFLPAFAFGLAWYTFSHTLGFQPSRSPIRCGLDRLTISQNYMTFCLAICLFLVNYRMLPVMSVMDDGAHRVSDALVPFHGEDCFGTRWFATVEIHVIVGALGLAVIFLRSWGILSRLGRSRANLSALTLALLAAGVLVPWSGFLDRIPTAADNRVFDLDLEDPAHRWLLLGDDNHREAGKLALARYYRTYDDEGVAFTYHELNYNFRLSWEYDDETPWSDEFDRARAAFMCELCRLPGVGAWTTTGLSLLLHESGPVASGEPNLVVEVPRLGTAFRLYHPAELPRLTVAAVEELPDYLGDEDWIVLKIDWAVKMGPVQKLLRDLVNHGVRRVDLAVMPQGFVPLPEAPVLLSLDDEERVPSFRKQRNPTRRDKKIIVVRQYFPPGTEPDPRPICYDLGRDEYHDAWWDWLPDPPGSLPARVAIKTSEDQPYGEFIGVFQGAVAGGANEIHLEVVEDVNTTEGQPE